MHVPLNVEKVTCHAVGIPMNRGRAIITLVHKEVIGKSSSHQALQEEVSDSFRLTKRNPTQMLDLASVLGCGSTPASPARQEGAFGYVATEVTTEGAAEDQQALRRKMLAEGRDDSWPPLHSGNP